MKSTTTYSIFFILLFLGSCIKPYNPDIPSMEGLLIVDGLVTDFPGQTFVSLTRTADYTASSLNLTVQKAQVTITDDKGQKTPLLEVGAGLYKPALSTWAGIAGRAYTLTITTTEGKTYRSQPDLLSAVPPIDTLYYSYSRKATAGSNYVDKGFDVYIDTKDPATPDNYYRWSWQAFQRTLFCEIEVVRNRFANSVETLIPHSCCSDCWDISRCYSCVTTTSDKFINGQKISRQPVLRAPFESIAPYYVEVTQYSISKAAFDYWKTVKSLAQNTGGIFDSAPITLGGNVSNVNDPAERVFGFFGASGASTKAVLINRANTGDTPNLLPPPPPVPSMPPPCRVCAESIYRTAIKPRWWTD